MKVVTINRKTWGTGALLTGGKMCCLGFCAKALGVADIDMTDVGLPYDVSGAVADRFESELGINRDLASSLAKINDGRSKHKEKLLRDLLTSDADECDYEQRVAFRFVGEK